MNFTISTTFKCNGHSFHKGEAVQLFPTRGPKLILKKKGLLLTIGPAIFKYLNEIEQPTMDQLYKWSHSYIGESPTGHLVECDGTGPDGFHSWLTYLDFI